MWPLLGAWPSHSVASDFTEGIRDPHGGSSFGPQVTALEGFGEPRNSVELKTQLAISLLAAKQDIQGLALYT